MPKIKSVELRKIYHFVLGSNFKRVRILKLFLKASCNIQVVRQLDTKFGCITCKHVIVYTSGTKQ
jgi:hypothetical protein